MFVSMDQPGDFPDLSSNSRPVFMKRLLHGKIDLRVGPIHSYIYTFYHRGSITPYFIKPGPELKILM